MTTTALLSDLRRKGVRLTPASGRLRIEAPKGIITPAVRAMLADRKGELLDLLTLDSTTASAQQPVEIEGHCPYCGVVVRNRQSRNYELRAAGLHECPSLSGTTGLRRTGPSSPARPTRSSSAG